MSPLKVNVIANEREVTNFEETHGVSCVNKSDKNLLDLPALVEVDELTDVFPSCIPSSEEVISSVDIQQNVAIGTATVILDCISEDDISASVQDSGETERIVTVIERIKKLPEDSTDTYETDSDIPYDDNLLLDDEVDLIPRKRSDAKVKSESLPELFQQRQPRTQIVIVDVEPEMKPKLSESDTWEKEFVVECKSTRGSEGGESGTVVAVREFLREVEDSERNVDNAMVFEPKNTIESLEIPVVELSPNMELIERAIIFDKIEANSEREVEVELEQKANKKKKRVQVIVPRKRIFNCCTLL